jgi:hypothetical protein
LNYIIGHTQITASGGGGGQSLITPFSFNVPNTIVTHEQMLKFLRTHVPCVSDDAEEMLWAQRHPDIGPDITVEVHHVYDAYKTANKYGFYVFGANGWGRGTSLAKALQKWNDINSTFNPYEPPEYHPCPQPTKKQSLLSLIGLR